MELQGNTILITGGGSGIGRGLAEAFHRLGNQVIIAGRRQAVLDQVTATNPGMQAVVLNVEEPEAIKSFTHRMADVYPKLNVLINNAGIQQPENIKDGVQDLSVAEAMVTTNLLGPMRLTAALLPLLRSQSRSTIVNVTSGLAFLPLAGVPTYCATKAALHAYTLSLRYQLRTTTTDVIELIPPYVQTDLGPNHGVDPRAMPLAEFITETMTTLRNKPNEAEVVVERCRPLRFADETGNFEVIYKRLNEAMG